MLQVHACEADRGTCWNEFEVNMRLVVLGMALALPAAALACPGRNDQTTASNTEQAEQVMADASSCAKSTALVGNQCSYTTGMMAQRVLAEGADFSFTGSLSQTPNDLASHVAAPFTLANGAVHVVANEVLDNVDAQARQTLEGKRLTVNGVDYFVVTRATALSAS